MALHLPSCLSALCGRAVGPCVCLVGGAETHLAMWCLLTEMWGGVAVFICDLWI